MSDFYTQVDCTVTHLTKEQALWIHSKAHDEDWWKEYDDDVAFFIRLAASVREPTAEQTDGYVVVLDALDEYGNVGQIVHLLQQFRIEFPQYDRDVRVCWAGYGGGQPDGGVVVVGPGGKDYWANTIDLEDLMLPVARKDEFPKVDYYAVPEGLRPTKLNQVVQKVLQQCFEQGHDMQVEYLLDTHNAFGKCRKCGSTFLYRADGYKIVQGDCPDLYPCTGKEE